MMKHLTGSEALFTNRIAHTKLARAFQAKSIFFAICLKVFIDLDKNIKVY